MSLLITQLVLCSTFAADLNLNPPEQVDEPKPAAKVDKSNVGAAVPRGMPQPLHDDQDPKQRNIHYDPLNPTGN